MCRPGSRRSATARPVRSRPSRRPPRPPAPKNRSGRHYPERLIGGLTREGIMDLASGTPASVILGAFAHWKVSVTGERHDQAADRRGGGGPPPPPRRGVGE